MKLFRFGINRNYRRLLVRYAKDLIVKYNGSGQASGSFSTFRRITSNWGFKYQCASCFPKDTIAQIYDNFHRQRQAARLGLAPFCCGFFVFMYEGDTYAGYLTQVANMKKSREALDDNYAPKFMHMIGHEEDCKAHPFFCEFKRLAIAAYKAFGMFWWDCKASNFGFINGRFVIIDWGTEGFYKTNNPWSVKQLPTWFKTEVGLA